MARPKPEPAQIRVTPAGVAIEFFDGEPIYQDGKEYATKRRYLVTDERVGMERKQLPSVTTLLKSVDPDGQRSRRFQNKTERDTLAGVAELANGGYCFAGEPATADLTVEELQRALGARELRWTQKLDQAADRGTLAHEDLVSLLVKGEVPDLDDRPEPVRGYIQGVCGFFADFRPEAHHTELMVASPKHGFAGRFDLQAKLQGRAAERYGVRGKLGLLDLKTTIKLKRDKAGKLWPPFTENFVQLEGYEIGAVECGYRDSEYRAVIRVDSTGAYDLTLSPAVPEDFLAAIGAHHQLRDLNKRIKEVAA